jgi:hypothetical protein
MSVPELPTSSSSLVVISGARMPTPRTRVVWLPLDRGAERPNRAGVDSVSSVRWLPIDTGVAHRAKVPRGGDRLVGGVAGFRAEDPLTQRLTLRRRPPSCSSTGRFGVRPVVVARDPQSHRPDRMSEWPERHVGDVHTSFRNSLRHDTRAVGTESRSSVTAAPLESRFERAAAVVTRRRSTCGCCRRQRFETTDGGRRR